MMLFDFKQRTLLLVKSQSSLPLTVTVTSIVHQLKQWMGILTLILIMDIVHVLWKTVPAGGEWTWVIACQSLKYA